MNIVLKICLYILAKYNFGEVMTDDSRWNLGKIKQSPTMWHLFPKR